MVSLLSTEGLTLPPASFTTSPEIAKRHKLAKARESEAMFGIILCLPAERPRSVIIDLDALYQSGEIDEALKEGRESEFKNGILAVGDREHEIILDSLTMTANDVFAIRAPHQRIDAFDKALREVSENTATHERLEKKKRATGIPANGESSWLDSSNVVKTEATIIGARACPELAVNRVGQYVVSRSERGRF
jgi:hypothetical protein